MKTGALIFAFNNEHIDYVRMAAWSAERIHRHLNLPVAVVTDAPDKARLYSSIDRVIEAVPESGGSRWFEDYQNTVTWHNAGRVDAYLLSPWQRTLVLDADYVVCSNQLHKILNAETEFFCHRTAWNLATGQLLDELNTFGNLKMPMWWATVMLFQRCNHAKFIFDSMNMIKQNWQHYRHLYSIDRPTYRNDFALSISLGIVSGQTWHIQEIPWGLASVLPETKLTQLDEDYFALEYLDSNAIPRTVGMGGTDFHAMGKQRLEKIIEAA